MTMASRFTKFLPQSKVSTLAPFHDPQRVYFDEHEPTVYSCTTDSEKRSFQLLDLPQRRWYEVNIPTPTWPPPPLSEEEQLRVEALTASHIAKQPTPFNTINIDTNNIVTYEIKPSIGIPLRKQPIVSESTFLTADYNDVTEKRYVYRAVDTCIWRGTRCIYKQLEFDDLIPQMEREIQSREALINGLGSTLLPTLGVAPILAVVVQGDPPLLQGILLPNSGVTFENVSVVGQITVQHLLSLLKTVKHLLAANVVHGDICARNICFNGPSIQLIDFGEIAPGYNSDVIASGEFLLWCRSRMTLSNEEKEKISRAANELIERENLDGSLTILEKN